MLNLGYDAPKMTLADDQLDRRRLALDIAEVIRSTPPTYSSRIGVFGRWGTGKTTVLEMLAAYLRSRGYVIVRFNPATTESFQDLIILFVDKLIQALTEDGLYVEPRPMQALRGLRSKLTSKTTAGIVEGAGEFHKGAKLLNASIGALSLWLSPTGEQAKLLREKLPESRVLVLIDDLDRCPARLLPQLLLSLREVLDLERFTFVLAFDEDIVADALKEANPYWGSGHKFLEKVLDFRFILPRISKDSRLRLISAELASVAPFVPSESVAEVADLLPDNPRRLKALVRSILALQNVIERHGEGEFAWKDVWLVELLRQESHSFVERLNQEQTFDAVLGAGYQIWTYSRRHAGAAPAKPDRLIDVLDKLKVRKGGARKRVEKLVGSIRARSSAGFQYVLSFANRAPALTWKEFASGYAKWSDSPQPGTLKKWIKAHANQRQDSQNRVAEEFWRALLQRMSESLNKAAKAIDRRTADSQYGVYLLELRCAISFFSCEEYATAARFQGMYSHFMFWVNVNRPGLERDVRRKEHKALVQVASRLSNAEKLETLKLLKPWGDSHLPSFHPNRTEPATALRHAVIDKLLPAAYSDLIVLLKTDGGVRLLSEPKVQEVSKHLLLGASFIPWPKEIRDVILDILEGCVGTVDRFEFVHRLFELMLDGLAYRGEVPREGVLKLLADSDLMNKLWSSVTARSLLLRGNIELLATREKFLDAGCPEEELPLTNELESTLPTYTEHREEYLQHI